MDVTGSTFVPLRFDAAWQERPILRDGAPVLLRFIRPDDKTALVRAFERLSPESRYRRFLSAKNRLREEELRYFTEVDGWDHVAIVALDPATGEGLGSGRFIRIAHEPEVAEAVITVADDWTERGLGRLLLDRMVEAARERGIRVFRVEVLARDHHMLKLVHELAPGVLCRARDGVVGVDVELPPRAGDAGREARRLLRLIAQGTLAAASLPERQT